MNKIKKAVIPIAGLGLRLLPFTKSVPKEMMPIDGKPVIDYIVNEAIEAGIEEILFVVNRHKKAVEDYFDRNFEFEIVAKEKKQKINMPDLEKKVKITYVKQFEPTGSGASIKLAKEFVNNQFFAVLYGDDLFEKNALKQLIKMYEETKGSVLAVKEVAEEIKSRYGIVEYQDQKLNNFFEKPEKNQTTSCYASLGRYIFSPQIFNEIEGEYVDGKEIMLTTAFQKLSKKEPIYICEIEGNHYDTGNLTDYTKAVIDFALKNKEMKMEIKRHIEKTR